MPGRCYTATFRGDDPESLIDASLACPVCLRGGAHWHLHLEPYDARGPARAAPTRSATHARDRRREIRLGRGASCPHRSARDARRPTCDDGETMPEGRVGLQERPRAPRSAEGPRAAFEIGSTADKA